MKLNALLEASSAIYTITKYHPAWEQYQLDYDAAFISPGIKPTPEKRKALQKQVVDQYMNDNMLKPEELEKIYKERKAKKIVHKLYGTD